MWRVIKFLFFIISPFGIYIYGKEFLNLFLYQHAYTLPNVQVFLTGLIPTSLLWFILGSKLTFFHVFEHEFTHMIIGLLFFKKPRVFIASEYGGAVELYGGNFIITLAPYFFPTFSYLLLLIFPLLNPSFYNYFYLSLGIITGYHISSTLIEFDFGQPDIITSGIVFSLLFCLFMNILTLGFLFYFVAYGFKGGVEFLRIFEVYLQRFLT